MKKKVQIFDGGMGSSLEEIGLINLNVEDLNIFEEGTLVTPALLKEVGLAKKQLDGNNFI